MPSKYRNNFQVKYTQAGTAIAFACVCGFKPKHIVVQNLSSLSKMEWFEGMSAANALITTAGTGVVTLVTANGITVDDNVKYNVNSTSGTITTVGSASTNTGKGYGFTVGLNTTVNILSEVLLIYAE